MACAPSEDSDPVWSESSLSARRKLGSLAAHWMHNEDSSQMGGCPGWSESLLGAHAILLVLSWGGSYELDLFIQVKLAYQESELLTLLKKIPLGPAELTVLRERADQLKEGTIKTRGDALLPISLASFIFDAFCLGGNTINPIRYRNVGAVLVGDCSHSSTHNWLSNMPDLDLLWSNY